MARMNVQFHATIEDIFDFLVNMLNMKYYVKGTILFPDFECYSISEIVSVNDIKKYDRFFISKEIIEDASTYNEFVTKQINNIGIDIGSQKEGTMTEMIMWICSENKIDSDFRKIINKFKKSMLKGAWGVGPKPNSEKYFYKNHLYTENAKKAYEQGVKLCAYAGSTYFELMNEQKL